MEIGRAIKEIRQEKNLSQGQVENLSGVSTSVLSRIESGSIEHPSIHIVARICKALSTGLDELCHRAGFPVQKPITRPAREAARLRRLWSRLRIAGRRLERARTQAQGALDEMTAAYEEARRFYRKTRAPFRGSEDE
jgi:transcriptional regulator with XRE-family HTH domain